VTKRLIEIDDDLLERARSATGSRTISDTVRRALEGVVAAGDPDRFDRLVGALAEIEFGERDSAWR
jgi:Arc/MetJ family transcription regulator